MELSRAIELLNDGYPFNEEVDCMFKQAVYDKEMRKKLENYANEEASRCEDHEAWARAYDWWTVSTACIVITESGR